MTARWNGRRGRLRRSRVALCHIGGEVVLPSSRDVFLKTGRTLGFRRVRTLSDSRRPARHLSGPSAARLNIPVRCCFRNAFGCSKTPPFASRRHTITAPRSRPETTRPIGCLCSPRESIDYGRGALEGCARSSDDVVARVERHARRHRRRERTCRREA